MTEKEIKINFASNLIPTFQELANEQNLRLYSLEFPVRTADGTKFVDMILENESKKLFVLEFKKGFIDIGAVEQVLRYSQFTKKQLYRDEVSSVIAGAEFSEFEKQIAKEHDVMCLQLDKNNMRLL